MARLLGFHWGTNREVTPWLIVVVLLIAVVGPSAFLWWFLQQAVVSQQLAVRQQATDLYRQQLQQWTRQFAEEWDASLAELAANSSSASAPELFSAWINADKIDGLIAWNDAGGWRFPRDAELVTLPPFDDPSQWVHAQELELEFHDDRQAVEIYLQMARHESQLTSRARAYQAAVRCLKRLQRLDEGLEIVATELEGETWNSAMDAFGRSIVVDLELLCVTSSDFPRDTRQAMIRKRLAHRIYGDREMRLSSAQRVFAHRQLAELDQGAPRDRHLDAEWLSMQIAEKLVDGSQVRSGRLLQPAPIESTWLRRLADQSLAIVIQQSRMERAWARFIAQQVVPAGATVRLIAPNSETVDGGMVTEIALGDAFPDWRVALAFRDSPIPALTQQRVASLYWTGILSLVAVVATTWLTGWMVQRYLRMARWKNDLVAVVSHELKTPLASMRVLVDTLLDDESTPPATAREYLELIAQENQRLSRLIDNFLTFSRFERRRERLQLQTTTVSQWMAMVQRSVASRGGNAVVECTFVIDNGTRRVEIDEEAMTTCMLNLIDNAQKHGRSSQPILVHAFDRASSVCVAVQDFGQGIPPREVRKIFRKFYQIDRSLSRRGEGCGLGLSIVDRIVRAHRGRVSVESRLGHGSTFTVALPRVERREDERE